MLEARSFLTRRAALAVIGTIIGAGIFALPAMFARVGFWPGTALFLLVTMAACAMHLLFVEISLAFRERRRLSGYAEKELGGIGFVLAAITYPLSSVGVILIYIILGGEFLSVLVRPFGGGGHLLFWQILFWFIGAALVFVGLKLVAKVEAYATWLLAAVLFAVIVLVARHIHPSFIEFSHWGNFAAPFGVFLFSLSGLSVIGEAVDIVHRDRKRAMEAVMAGTLTAALLSWMFGATVYLAVGPRISVDPTQIIGLMPGGLGWLVPTLGFFAVLTSYITTAQDLKATLHLDFRFSKNLAWVLALFAPLILFFVTSRDFLKTVETVGAIFGGMDGILVAWLAFHLFRHRRRHPPFVWAFIIPLILIAIFGLGLAYKLVAV